MFKIKYHDNCRIKYRRLEKGKFAVFNGDFGDSYEIEITSKKKPFIANTRRYLIRGNSPDWTIQLSFANFFSAYIFIGDYEFRPLFDVYRIGLERDNYFYYTATIKNMIGTVKNGMLYYNNIFVRSLNGLTPIRCENATPYEALMLHFISTNNLAGITDHLEIVTDRMILAAMFNSPIIFEYLKMHSKKVSPTLERIASQMPLLTGKVSDF